MPLGEMRDCKHADSTRPAKVEPHASTGEARDDRPQKREATSHDRLRLPQCR